MYISARGGPTKRPYNVSYKDHSELVQMIADPHDHTPVRLPTYPNVERTSTLALVSTSQATVPSAGVGYAMVIRSPAVPVWMTQTFAGTFSVSCLFNQGSSMGALPVVNGESLALTPLLSGTPILSANPSWPLWTGLCCDKNEDFWFWAPPGTQFGMSVGFSGTVTGGLWVMSYEYIQSFTSSDSVRGNSNMSISGSTLVSTGVNSYGLFWRPLTLTCNTSSAGNVPITNLTISAVTGLTFPTPSSGTISGLLPLAAKPPEFDVTTLIYTACRVNALSVLFQNTTAVLNKEGSVEALLMSSSQFSPTIVSTLFDYTSTGSDVAACSRYLGLLEKGLYTFTLPDAGSARFQDASARVNFVVGPAGQTPILNLDSFDYINMIRFTDYSSVATNLLVTVDMHLEFRNSTMLWPIGVAAIELEAWHKAQVSVTSMIPFFENPTHLMAIANLARAAAIRMYPIIRPALVTGARMARDKLLNMAANALTNKIGNTQIALRGAKPAARPKAKRAPQKRKKATRR